ncbi:MAG: hypothetical protein F4W92_09145 [Gammaproteobacteria bacterium]|nr:hypothetical protein [Gammaproteobacteria bacterium]
MQDVSHKKRTIELRYLQVKIKNYLIVSVLLFPILILAEVVDLDDLIMGENSVDNFYGDEDDYEKREYQGFNFYIKSDILESKKETAETAYALIKSQLYQMKFLFPVKVMEKLEAESVKIVLNDDCGDSQCLTLPSLCTRACYVSYSSSADEFYSKTIVFRNLVDLLKEFPTQPSALIHEFAHAFHNLIIPDGFDDQTIIDSWQEAVDSGKYELVNYISNDDDEETSKKQHNLLKNVQEYFAEISEALWLRSEYEPFVFHEVFVDEVLTNRTELQNPIWDAWWIHSGPHELGRTWYNEVLGNDEDDNSVNSTSSDEPSLIDLDQSQK